MKIVVFGGNGRAGSAIASALRSAGHAVGIGSRAQGVDTVTGAGVATALHGADALVDATDSPSGDPAEFFRKSTAVLLEHAAQVQLRHFIELSIVGVDRMPGSPYMRAKAAQEQLIRNAGVPYTIVRSTQFQEFLPDLLEAFRRGADEVRVPDARIQPVALADVATYIGELLAEGARNGIVDIGGPRDMAIADALTIVAARRREQARVIADGAVTYFGAALEPDTLLPMPGAHLGTG